MRTLYRLTIGLLALGFAIAPAWPAAAEPTPSAPPCKSGVLKMTPPSGVAVASQPDTYVSRTTTLQNTSGHSFTDWALTFEVWPDQGGLTLAPKLRYTGSGGPVAITLRRVNSARPVWRAAVKPPTIWPTGTPSFARFELAWSASSASTTYSTRLTATAGVCGTTVLGATTGMKYSFTAGLPPVAASVTASATRSASPRASAKPSRKPTPSPGADEEVLPPPDDTTPEESPSDGEAVAGQDLASGEPSGSPLPWIAGLGVTALIVAGGLLWWVRRTSYDED